MALTSPAFQFYVKEWMSSTRVMSPEAKGVYMDFLAWSWDNGPLPTHEADLARLAGVSSRRFATIWLALKSKWTKSADGYVNRRLEEQREALAAYRKQQAEKGRRSAAARSGPGNSGNHGSTAVASRLPSGSNRAPNRTPNREATLQSALCDLQTAEDPTDTEAGTDGVAPVWSQSRPSRTGLATNHLKCSTIAAAACGRGICVPAFLVEREWLPQVEHNREHVRQFVQRVVDGLPAGPVGDEPLLFWRAQWRDAHGTQAPSPRTRQLGPDYGTAPDWQDECRELHNSRCGNSVFHDAKMAEDKAAS